MDLSAIREEVEREIASYVYAVPAGAVGRPASDAWVEAQLAEMSASLVQPIWRFIAIRDTFQQLTAQSEPEVRQCVLVADDRKGNELYYDPVENGYVLAHSGEPPATFNVRGDAVGCFMAR